MRALENIFGSLGNFVDLTFFLILIFLVLTRAEGFSTVVKAVSDTYLEGIRALQGR